MSPAHVVVFSACPLCGDDRLEEKPRKATEYDISCGACDAKWFAENSTGLGYSARLTAPGTSGRGNRLMGRKVDLPFWSPLIATSVGDREWRDGLWNGGKCLCALVHMAQG